jgi:hypothetical protein
MAFLFATGRHRESLAVVAFLLLWLAHYLRRALAYRSARRPRLVDAAADVAAG